MYKIQNQYTAGEVIGQTIIRQNADGTVSSFLADPANTDFQEYQRWLAEGNTPLAADAMTPQENGDTFTLSV